jgi:hypothetical protein
MAMLTVGPFIVPVALVMTVLPWRKHRAGRELLGLVFGLALPLLYVAYLNRDGPGTVCTTGRDGSQSCTGAARSSGTLMARRSVRCLTIGRSGRFLCQLIESGRCTRAKDSRVRVDVSRRRCGES